MMAALIGFLYRKMIFRYPVSPRSHDPEGWLDGLKSEFGQRTRPASASMFPVGTIETCFGWMLSDVERNHAAEAKTFADIVAVLEAYCCGAFAFQRLAAYADDDL